MGIKKILGGARKNRVIFWTALLFYVLSLVTPAVVTAHHPMGIGEGTIPGWHILLMGWLALLAGSPMLGWYAQIPFFIALSLIFRNQWKSALRWSLAAAVLASTTVFWFTIPLPVDVYLSYPHIGFVLWYGAILMVLVTSAEHIVTGQT